MPGQTDLESRVDRIESRLSIAQLPIRYALALDSRDLEAWASLFVPDVVGWDGETGREAMVRFASPLLRTFERSIHLICGHSITLDSHDIDHATGAVYCRAEHEVGERWIVVAICYFDEYRRIDGAWLFESRTERHWYAVDISEHPQDVGFGSWSNLGPPELPMSFATWDPFWAG